MRFWPIFEMFPTHREYSDSIVCIQSGGNGLCKRIASFGKKAVVNLCDGRFLGHICNLHIDCCTGCILCIVVPGPCKCFGLIKNGPDYVIPWRRITKIGEDVILVDLDERGKAEK